MRVPTGRYEERTPRAVTVEFLRFDELQSLRFDELQSNKRAVTENVSPRGARIVTDWNCAPGKHALVTAPRPRHKTPVTQNGEDPRNSRRAARTRKRENNPQRRSRTTATMRQRPARSQHRPSLRKRRSPEARQRQIERDGGTSYECG